MLLTDRYADQIQGVYSCYDRVVIQGTLPGFCYAEGMTSYLYANNIRMFDYPKFADSLRHELRFNAEQIAEKNDLQKGVETMCYFKRKIKNISILPRNR